MELIMSKVYTKPAQGAIKSAIAEVCVSQPISAHDALNQPLANEKARKGAGAALADMLCTELQQQAGKLKMYVQSLMDLDSDGRMGFTSYLGAVIKERRVLVKENGTSLYKAINASASVRLAEMNTICKALDKGLTIDLEQSYHTIVGQAREHLRALGEGDKRGRKATHGIVKLYNYVAKLDVIDAADKAAVEAVMAECEQQLLALGLAVEKGEDAPM
jgi:hypothetical protein